MSDMFVFVFNSSSVQKIPVVEIVEFVERERARVALELRGPVVQLEQEDGGEQQRRRRHDVATGDQSRVASVQSDSSVPLRWGPGRLVAKNAV